METVFLGAVNRSITAGYLVLVILLLRWVFRKAPRSFWLVAWAMVAFRLLCPISIESPMSLVPSEEPIHIESSYQMQAPEEKSQTEKIDREENPALSMEADREEAAEEPSSILPGKNLSTKERIAKIGAVIWICGMAILLTGGLVSLIRLRLRIREAVEWKEGIYFCDRIDTPFLLGFLHPGIYLPSDIAPEDVSFVVAHERAHMARRDPWWKLMGFLLLIVYWFQPLLWVAYILFSRDLEYACDEKAVRNREIQWKKQYMQALIRCSVSRRSLTVLAFGEVGVKERVKNIMKYQKPGIVITVVALMIAIALGLFFMTNRPEDPEVFKVSTVDEFLEALGSDREITLSPGTYDLTTASNYGKNTDQDAGYTWSEMPGDGYQLNLKNLKNLTIRGSGQGKTNLVTVPRTVEVLDFALCENLLLEDMTIGHTEGGEMCSGSVLYLSGGKDVILNRLGLYGCGTIGVYALQTENLTVTDCEIYECSHAGIDLNNCVNVSIAGCNLHDLRKNPEDEVPARAVFLLWNSGGVSIADCRVENNEISNLISASGSEVTVSNTQFAGNQLLDAAFWLEMGNTVFDGNTFENNEIRSWYKTSGQKAVDTLGNEITEEMLSPASQKPQAEAQQKQVTASTVDEFLAAIAPNTEIILDGELYDLSQATGYGQEKTEYYFWYEEYDGPELIITGVDNLSIRTNDGDVKAHTISAVPRYADVLEFRQCSNVKLSGFTAGHTKEPGSCSGGVIQFGDSKHMTVENCGLFGCGILGVQANYCSDITVANSEIYECSNGGIRMDDCEDIQVNGCTFRDLGGPTYLFQRCTNVSIDGEPFDPHAKYD